MYTDLNVHTHTHTCTHISLCMFIWFLFLHRLIHMPCVIYVCSQLFITFDGIYINWLLWTTWSKEPSPLPDLLQSSHAVVKKPAKDDLNLNKSYILSILSNSSYCITHVCIYEMIKKLLRVLYACMHAGIKKLLRVLYACMQV